MSEDQKSEESWFVELFRLLGELLRPARNWLAKAGSWSLAQANAYLSMVRRNAIRTGIVFGVSLVVAAIGAFTNINWLISLSLIVSAIALAVLSFLSFPILVLAAKFSELRSVQTAFRAVLWAVTLMFGLALLLLVVPLSPSGVVIVVLGSIILSALYLVTGATPNFDRIRRRAIILVVVTILAAFAQQTMPQVSITAARAVSTLDQKAARWLNMELLPPGTARFQNPEECWSATFFDQDGIELYWYERAVTGELLLFDRAGVSPFTRNKLEAVTPEIRSELCTAMQKVRETEAAARMELGRSNTETRIGSTPEGVGTSQGAGGTERITAASVDPGSMVASSAEPAIVLRDTSADEIAAVEALASAGPMQSFAARPEWTRDLIGKPITIRFSSESRQLAAAYLQRLRSLGLTVTLAPSGSGSAVASPSIEYTQNDTQAAEGLNALLGDLARHDLNSHRAYVPLQVQLP